MNSDNVFENFDEELLLWLKKSLIDEKNRRKGIKEREDEATD